MNLSPLSGPHVKAPVLVKQPGTFGSTTRIPSADMRFMGGHNPNRKSWGECLKDVIDNIGQTIDEVQEQLGIRPKPQPVPIPVPVEDPATRRRQRRPFNRLA